MQCLKCSETLAVSSYLFFFVKGAKDVHLSIKPELYQLIKIEDKLYELQENKKVRLKCKKCNNNLGCILPFGASGSKFCAFASDKVKLCNRNLSKSEKWWNIYKDFEMEIELRDEKSFFGTSTEGFVEQICIRKTAATKTIFPSVDNLHSFEWFSVSLKKVPRPYQIQAFVEALQRNLIVVLNTGFGKTLIASMLISRMCDLNPQKMGLMIVDRIPLVFQHATAISNDTNLKVVPLCGENKTKHLIKRINDGVYDVVVVTAGAFNELVIQELIDVHLFCVVVIDECHHAIGGHRYVDVVQFFTRMSLATQPRILGLTASLINANNVLQAEDQLQKFLLNFPSARIFCPETNKSHQDVISEVFEYTNNQSSFLNKVVETFNAHLRDKIYAPLKISGIELQQDLLNSYQIIGELRTIENNYQAVPELVLAVKRAFLYIESLEMCAIMGVRTAYNLLKDEVKEIVYDNIYEDSARLNRLSAILKGLKENSKVLVFVHTRAVARVLYEFLCKNFGTFKPRMVFGHGGYDGMLWEDEQELAIMEFAGGDCNLIVCTSVLEEGLDVAECDVVMSFTGFRSLIQFIQIRGRARKHGSKFYVFQNSSERKSSSAIMMKEDIMNKALQNHSSSFSLFSKLSKDIIKKIQEQTTDDSSINSDSFILGDKITEAGSFSFLLYVENVKTDSFAAKEKILEALQEFSIFKVKQLEILNTTAEIKSSARRVFNKDCLVVLVGAQVQLSKCTPFDGYLQFCRTFNFDIKCEDGNSAWELWSQFSTKPVDLKRFEPVKLIKIGIGYFVNKTSCVIEVEMPAISCVFSNKEFSITYCENISTDDAYGSKKSSFEVPLTSLGSFSLVSVDQHHFSLNMVLLHAPFFYILEKEKVRSSSSPALSEAFSKYPLLQITFPMDCFRSVQQALLSPKLFPVPHFYVKLKSVQSANNCSQYFCEKDGMKTLTWYLGCIKDSRLLCLPTDPLYSIVNSIGRQTNSGSPRDKVLQLCKAAVKTVFTCINKHSYFEPFVTIYEKKLGFLSKINASKRNNLKDVTPTNYIMIKRVIATPTRLVMLPPVPVASNRMIRFLHDYRILTVSFRDEDMSKLHDSNAQSFVSSYLTEGIVINNLKYYFLATSGSQLRDHKAYFIQVSCDAEVKKLRSQIIPYPEKFSNPAKYLSRLGFYATADMGKLFEINPNQCAWIDDLKAENGDLTTDGCGKISLTLAAQIAVRLCINRPSALQIRFAGVKGMLVCTIDKDPELRNRALAFRHSMKKFENADKGFCVVSYSKYNKLTLNREVINLLTAVNSDQLGEDLMRKQECELQKVADIFHKKSSARTALGEFLQQENVRKLSLVNFHNEKFWFSVLQGIYRLKIQNLQKRTNIPVEKGCLLVGVPDPCGILKEGEIFVQIENDKKKEIIIGDALVYRNPCLHPGDLRLVCGVDRPSLRYLVNVVVFPAVNCVSSLAASCSGGDFDGDQFAIMWDANLIPPKHLIYPPFNYSELTSSPYTDRVADVTNEVVLSDFIVKFMENDSLGRVAHKHLALCDFIENGARNPLAIELAKSQAAAVDYAKTGILPNVPLEAMELVRKNGFPDFMEKSECYSSNKILGYLYRRCKSIGFNFEVISKDNIENALDFRLQVDGYQEYLGDALEVYICYDYNMKMIMSKFDLKVEADVVLGCATFAWSTHLDADRGKATKSIAECYQTVVRKFREIFFSDVTDGVSRAKKACAWYNLVNNNAIKVHGRKHKMLSFPWVVSDVLCEIFLKNQNQRPSRMFVDIGLSALNYFNKHSALLLKNIMDKTKVLNIVDLCIQRFVKTEYKMNKVFKVSIYGSTSIYACEPESDVDICVFAEQSVYSSNIFPTQLKDRINDLSDVEKEKHILQFVVSRALDSVVSSKREVLDAKIPIVKCVVGNEDSAVNCDVSMNLVGRFKTRYIHFLYQSNCLYFPLFWILVKWARCVGLVKGFEICSSVMDTADFYLLIIDLVKLKIHDEDSFGESSQHCGILSLYHCLDKLKRTEKDKLGLMLIDFFRKAAELNGNVVMKWPASDLPPVSLSNKVTESISTFAQSAFNCISATRNINTLFLHVLNSNHKSMKYNIKLPLSVSYAMGLACSFHSARLSQLTGALVAVTPIEGSKNLSVNAEGSFLSINFLRSEIRNLIDTNKALTLGSLPKKVSRYFMDGSSFLMVEGKALSSDPLIKFEESLGAYELLHICNQRSSLYLEVDSKASSSWLEDEYSRFQSCISKQMSKFPRVKKLPIDVTSRFGCFYLIDLSKRLPDSKTCIRMSEIERAVERGRLTRKEWKRGDYKPSLNKQDIDNDILTPIKLVKLAPAKTSFAKIANKVKRKKKSMYTGLASAFTPGLLQCNAHDENVRQKLLSVYEKVLSDCGFQNGSSFSRLVSSWKISLSPSTSYEVEMRLNDHLEVLQIAERPLNWLHGTFVSCKKQIFKDQIQINPDIRFQISSQDSIEPDSELYNAVYPLIKGVRTLPITLRDGKPILQLFGGRSFVNSIRHVELVQKMTNGSVDASIAYGESFFGCEMLLKRPFCELTLYFNSEKLTKSLENFTNFDLLNEFANEFYYTSIKVREKLETVLGQI